MNFKIKKIRKKKPLWKRKGIKSFLLGILWGALFVSVAYSAVFFFFSGEPPSRRILSALSSDLKVDSFGHTNILFLGVAGETEEGGNLSDSIIIASINPQKPAVSFLSLPRDLYITSPVGDRKINEIYAVARHKYGEEKALEIIKKAIGDFTQVDLHYVAVINFQVFKEVVDAIGGVKIFVPEDIVDPFYPTENYGYETFIIRRGIHTLDGETALKYARSRKTSSDYHRAKRQQDLLFAIKQKMEQEGFFANLSKLKDFYNTYKKHIVTDITWRELLRLAQIAQKVDYQHLITAVLNDDPSKMGGFLYAPAREFYGGHFVLLPRNLKDTQKFIQLVLLEPEVLLENAQLAVLNGSKINKLASRMAQRLRRFGFHVIEVGNYETEEPVFKSFYQVVSQNNTERTQKFLRAYLDIQPKVVPQEHHIGTPNMQQDDVVDIEIILGITEASLDY